ncbi:hypothetical protein PIROE2DRAFT_9860 [Piromyces sp. E2]|nr:hypothetical protein PIROE2DRAFT_9860 [Piromyces sp. E2]|eukprot:OUM63577.1 hypothetical protein PIROE2DRAFT_9860 [Piromyces sp. E2]
MKYFTVSLLSLLLFVKHSTTLNCDEAKQILNVTYNGNCCDLQQVVCDEAKENILYIDFNFDDNKLNNHLSRRRGGGGGRVVGGRAAGFRGANAGKKGWGVGYGWRFPVSPGCLRVDLTTEETVKCFEEESESFAQEMGYNSMDEYMKAKGYDFESFKKKVDDAGSLEEYMKKEGIDLNEYGTPSELLKYRDYSLQSSSSQSSSSQSSSSQSSSSQSSKSYSDEFEEKLRKGEAVHPDAVTSSNGNSSHESSSYSSNYSSSGPSSYSSYEEFIKSKESLPSPSPYDYTSNYSSLNSNPSSNLNKDTTSGSRQTYELNLFICFVIMSIAINMINI